MSGRKFSKRRKLQKALNCEALEARMLLAGDICFPFEPVATEQLGDGSRTAALPEAKLNESLSQLTPTHSYSADGQEIPLVVHPHRVAISIEDAQLHAVSGLPSDITAIRAVNDSVTIYESKSLTSDQLLSIFADSSQAEVVSPVFFAQESMSEAVALDEVTLRLKAGVDPVEFFASHDEIVQFRALRGSSDQFVAKIAGSFGEQTLAIADDLNGDSDVEWATPNFYQNWQRFAAPNDARFGNQFYLHNTGQEGGVVDADVDLPEALDIVPGGASSIVVGVVDDGVDISHPDLAFWSNPGGDFLNGVDDDGNGYIDDFNGWSAITQDGDIQPIDDDDNHGTAVAGLAAARTNNSIGIAGASGATGGSQVATGKIFEGATSASNAEIAETLRWMAGFGAGGGSDFTAADIVVAAWGLGSPSTDITSAITDGTATGNGGAGLMYVFAAGNSNGSVSYPASLSETIDGVVAVGATTNFGTRAGYSNNGAGLDVVAPSDGGTLAVDSTDRFGPEGFDDGNYTGTGAAGSDGPGVVANGSEGGTSSSAAIVTGLGALALQRASNVGESLDPADLKALMRQNTDLVGGATYDTATGWNSEYGYGQLNAAALVAGIGNAEISIVSATEELENGGAGGNAGTVFLGETADLTFRIRNQGTEDLVISDITDDGGAFSVLSGPADDTLSIGESTTFEIRFTGISSGTLSGDITVSSNDSDEGTFVFTLEGDVLVKSVTGTVFEDGNASGVVDPWEALLPGTMVYVDANDNDMFDVTTESVDTTVPVNIVDNTTVTSEIDVSGLPTSIFDVDVNLDITHTWDSDLDAVLTAPNGQQVLLFSSVGGSGDDFTDTVLDDEAALSINDGAAPFTGSFRPEEPLSLFDGIDPNGTWTLAITDNAGGDQGVLNEWGMTFVTDQEANTTTDANGEYLFISLPVGTHTLRTEDSMDWAVVTPGSGEQVITIADPDDQLVDVNFGVGYNNRFYANVFDDLNKDGVVDPGEDPIEGVPVFSDTNGNGIWETGVVTSNFLQDTPVDLDDSAGDTLWESALDVTGVGTILDVNVRVDITHTWDSDLVATLVSPDGTEVLLFAGEGGSGQNFTDTVLDDEAAIPIAGQSAPFTGTFQPEGTLSDFDGLLGTGEWILRIEDTFAFADQGVLNEWELEIEYDAGELGALTDVNGNVAINLPPGPHDMTLELQTDWEYTVPVDGVISETAAGAPMAGRQFGTTEQNVSVATVVINDGASQRGMVTQLEVTFDDIATIMPDAFLIERVSDGATVDVSVATDDSSGVTVATLTFTGGAIEANSLADGNYIMTIDATKVTTGGGVQLDGDGDGTPGGDYVFGDEEVDTFYRLFGDVAGAGGSSDPDRVVNFDDFFALRDAFGTGAGDPDFEPGLDSNSDGVINFDDFFAFRDAFGGNLPFGS